MLGINPPRKIIIKLSIIVTAVFLLEFLVFQISFAQPPKVQVTRPAAVINFDPGNLSQNFRTKDRLNNYHQKNMLFKWGEQVEPEENLEITLKGDLNLVSATNSKQESDFGFSKLKNSSADKIPAEAVMVKIGNDSRYQPLDQSREILATEDKKIELEFKLAEDIIAANWQNLPAGTYRAELESSNYELKNNPRLQVNLKEHLEINLDDATLEMEINDPTLTGDPETIDQYNDSLNWKVNSNTPVSVSFSSQGGSDYKSLTEEKAKDFFRYLIKNGSTDEEEHFAPAEAQTVDFSEGELEVLYSTDFENEKGMFANQEEKKEWHQLTAGKYQDTIKITVEAQ